MRAARPVDVAGRRRLAGVVVLVVALVVLGWQTADGLSMSRRWMGDAYRAESTLAADLAECLGRDIARVVPEGARVHVSRAEAAQLSEVYFLQLVEYAYRRATFVGDPAEADLLLTVALTPERGCNGVSAVVRPGGRAG